MQLLVIFWDYLIEHNGDSASFFTLLLVLFCLLTVKGVAVPNWPGPGDKKPIDTLNLHLSDRFYLNINDSSFLPAFDCRSKYDNHTINIYRLDMTKLQDTFPVVIQGRVANRNFTFPIVGEVTSGFGHRDLWGGHFHYGIDIDLKTGDTVLAAMDGFVRVVRYEPGYGNFVVITHEDGLETLYGHLSGFLIKEGDEVKSGQPIARGGGTGRVTGPHLHFEFRFMGEQIDPTKVLSFEEQKVLQDTILVEKTWFNHLLERQKIAAIAKYHVVRQGDTLSAIAQRYHTSITRLCSYNGISSRTILKLGRKIRIQ